MPIWGCRTMTDATPTRSHGPASRAGTMLAELSTTAKVLVTLGIVLVAWGFGSGLMLDVFQTGQVPFSHLINAVFGTSIHHWSETGMPDLAAIGATLVVMMLLAWLVVRLIFEPLVNQPGIILFMATIGLAFVLEGVGD